MSPYFFGGKTIYKVHINVASLSIHNVCAFYEPPCIIIIKIGKKLGNKKLLKKLNKFSGPNFLIYF